MYSVDSNPVVLVADDDPDDRQLIQEAFTDRRPDCRLYFVHNGAELMAFLSDKNPPDLVLLDLNMPLMDGREALVEIRGNPRFQTMSIVVMTTSGSDEDKGFCLENGANFFIVKPPRYTELLELIEALAPYFTPNTDSR